MAEAHFSSTIKVQEACFAAGGSGYPAVSGGSLQELGSAYKRIMEDPRSHLGKAFPRHNVNYFSDDHGFEFHELRLPEGSALLPDGSHGKGKPQLFCRECEHSPPQ